MHQQEGFNEALSVPAGEAPRCSSYFSAHPMALADFRGGVTDAPDAIRPHGDLKYAEWETAAVAEAGDITFTWIGASQVRPMRSMFPYVKATLTINGKHTLEFPLGMHPEGWRVVNGDIALAFEPRRHQSLVERMHRTLAPSGTAGFYRLEVPARLLTSGEPLCLRVDLPAAQKGIETFFFVSPRRDALKVDLEILRGEVAQLQRDMVQLKASHEILYTQLYPHLFPKRIEGEMVVACQDETLHYHPPSLIVMADGEVVISVRQAADHLDVNGRIVALRSRDGGRTWTAPEVLFDLGGVDHRGSPLFELPNGDWLATDYRAGGLYQSGIFDWTKDTIPTLWGVWSTDRGKTWTFSDEALVVPGAAYPFAEVERPMIRLDSGRLLVSASYVPAGEEKKPEALQECNVCVFCSDDNGRSWRYLSSQAPYPLLHGEAPMLLTASGKIILLSRVPLGMGANPLHDSGLLQSDSLDGGETWSPWRATGMSSMNTPGHLITLQDGRILCTHASRGYPGEINLTLSHDEGETWDTANTRIVANDLASWDSTYPTTGQLADGTLLTTWYANLFGKFHLPVLRYRPEQL